MSIFLIIVLVLSLCISVNAESNVKKSNISLSQLNNQYMEEALSNPDLTLQQRNEIIKKYEFAAKVSEI